MIYLVEIIMSQGYVWGLGSIGFMKAIFSSRDNPQYVRLKG